MGHRGANGAAIPTDEGNQDGHFFYNHPEGGLLRCLGDTATAVWIQFPTEGGVKKNWLSEAHRSIGTSSTSALTTRRENERQLFSPAQPGSLGTWNGRWTRTGTIKVLNETFKSENVSLVLHGY